MGASEILLALDWDRTAVLIAEFIRREAEERRHDGVLLGISGGLDSAVAAALACEALGPRRVRGVILPERDTHPDSVGDARAVARHLGIPQRIIDKAPSPDVAPGITDEFAMGLSYQTLDLVLHGLDREWDDARILALSGADADQVDRVRQMVQASERMHHLPPYPRVRPTP